MLNHVWAALLVLGILTAAGRDVYESNENAYGNGIPWSMEMLGPHDGNAASLPVRVRIADGELRRHFPGMKTVAAPVELNATMRPHSSGGGVLVLALGDDAPDRFAAMAQALGTKGSLAVHYTRASGDSARVAVSMQPVRFVYLRRITTAAFDAAGTAVEIAFGLIGVMALWLGMMKIAEAAGLVALLARAVRPLMVRLFPDVPQDHPALASIIMNIAANMLGLGNAATPFGLKAMEQLNEINPRAGTASNAMCTFLALNTSCITLIPASAIAIRATLGSPNPAIIIGTTFLASLGATTVALIAAKTLERTRWFRLPEEAA